MNDEFSDTLHEVVTRLEAQGIEYMLVGSIAALAHGRSRSTADFDIVIDASLAQLRALVRSFPDDRFYASEVAAVQALQHQSQFNVIDMVTGWKADLIVKKRRAFSDAEFGRRHLLTVLGAPMQVATVEDTIVAKLEWSRAAGGSARQLEDVTELVRLAGARLDRAYVSQWVVALGLSAEWAEVTASIEADSD